jgi:hypothetical protein
MIITLLSPSQEVIRRYEHDKDIYAGNRRALLMHDSLFAPGAAPLRRKTLGCSARLAEQGKPVPHHLPASTKRIIVESPAYRAEYLIQYMVWQPIQLFLPEGMGDNKFGDFSDWEFQPYEYEWAYPPMNWESERGSLYVRCAEDSPFQGDDNRAEQFTRALIRTRREWDGKTLHLMGKNLSYAQLVRPCPVIDSRPTPKKRKGVRQ